MLENVALLTECGQHSCGKCHLLSGVQNVTHDVRKWLEAIRKKEDIQPRSVGQSQGQERDGISQRMGRLGCGLEDLGLESR